MQSLQAVALAEPFRRRAEETASERAGWPLAVLAVIAAGAVLRIVRYVDCRSLWIDEAFLASTVMNRHSFFEFFQALDYSQSTPFGFLLAAKCCTLIFGENEYALRLIPLLASLAGLPLTWIVGRKWLPVGPALIAVFAVAVSEPLIYFASEFKAYSVEATTTLALLWLGERASDESRARPWIRLYVAGPLAILFSHSAIFVLAGIGTALALFDARARNWKSLAPLVPVGMVWLAAFAASFLGLLAFKIADPHEMEFWSDGFIRLGVSWGVVNGWVGRAHHVMHETLGMALPGLAVALMTMGAMSLLREAPRRAAVWLLPLAFLALGSLIQKYSLMGRLVLFIAPLLALLIGAGFRYLSRVGGPERRWIVAALALFVLAYPTTKAVDNMLAPLKREEVRDALAHIGANRQAGDVLFLKYSAEPAYRFYAGRHIDLSGMELVEGKNWIEIRDFFREVREFWHREAAPRTDRPRRLWLVFSSQVPIVELDHDPLADTARRVERQKWPGVVVYLYEFESP